MQKILDDLTKLNNQCPEHSMRAIDIQGFEKYFAKINGELNHLYKQMHSSEESMPIIKVAYQLLDKACRHHLNENIVSTQYAVELFNHAVQLLLKIINADFGVDKEAYDKA